MLPIKIKIQLRSAIYQTNTQQNYQERKGTKLQKD